MPVGAQGGNLPPSAFQEMPEEEAERVRLAGGWCPRRFWMFLLMASPRVSALTSQGDREVQPVPFGGGALCVGRSGICPLWDKKRGQCLDRTVAQLRADYYEARLKEMRG